jgi:hypothetical protein
MTTGLNAMASAGASKGFNAPNSIWDHRPGLRFAWRDQGVIRSKNEVKKVGIFTPSPL